MIFKYILEKKTLGLNSFYRGIVFGDNFDSAVGKLLDYYGHDVNIINLKLKIIEDAGDWVVESDSYFNDKVII